MDWFQNKLGNSCNWNLDSTPKKETIQSYLIHICGLFLNCMVNHHEATLHQIDWKSHNNRLGLMKASLCQLLPKEQNMLTSASYLGTVLYDMTPEHFCYLPMCIKLNNYAWTDIQIYTTGKEIRIHWHISTRSMFVYLLHRFNSHYCNNPLLLFISQPRMRAFCIARNILCCIYSMVINSRLGIANSMS